jgi:hypothetical protein
MKSNYLGWGLAGAIGLAAGLGVSFWTIALVSFGACGVLALGGMLRKRRSKASDAG